MRLTTKTTHAVRAMLYLANQPEGRTVSLIEIAQHQDITPKYLEQIFLRLHRAKLLESKKGPGGGYFIDRPLRSIKISEIMNAVGESNAPVSCLVKNRNCARAKHCLTRPYWQKLQKLIDNFLDSSTLYDIWKESVYNEGD